MINLGLQRITLLLNPLFAAHPRLPWRAVHIAGTNGKGSVAALVSTFLSHLGYSVGRFTSPHLIDRWDCITINKNVVHRDKFLPIEQHFREFSIGHNIGASEFEILTATAFQLFTDEKVDVAVIECGLGGREDATNVLRSEDVILSVLTKVGLDHTEFLGDTIEAITAEKAGIFKSGVPIIVDQSNSKGVLEVAGKRSKELGCKADGQDELYISCEEQTKDFETLIHQLKLGQYQAQNLYTAWSAFRRAEASLNALHSKRRPSPSLITPPQAKSHSIAGSWPQEPVTPDRQLSLESAPVPRPSVKASLETLIVEAQSSLPGRLQVLTIPATLLPRDLIGTPRRTDSLVPEIAKTIQVLLDGAHNAQSAEGLANFVDDNVRPNHSLLLPDRFRGITWLLAMKSDKDINNILSTLIQPQDNIITCAFGPVDSMPWVKAMSAVELAAKADHLTQGIVKAVPDEDGLPCTVFDFPPPDGDAQEPSHDDKIVAALQEAIKVAAKQDFPNLICITGSLYLVGDILRCVRNAGGSIYEHGQMNTRDVVDAQSS